MKPSLQLQTRQTLSLSMTPQMIQSISLMSLTSEDLIDRIYEEVEKNPALEIVKESSYKDVQPRQKKDNSTLDGDKYQAFLESLPSSRNSLKEHLLSQLAVQKISLEDRKIASSVINNLSDEGYHLVSFEELFSGKIPENLDKILALIQHFDPIGLATTGVQESLLVQALSLANSSPFVIELLQLEGEVFSRIFTPLRPTLIVKKLQEFDEKRFQNIDVNKVEEALDFIKNLEPHPARNFSLTQAAYVIPDVKIRRATGDEKEETGELFVVEYLKGVLPELAISKSFEQFTKKTANKDKNTNKEKSKEEERFVKEAVQDANWFLNSLLQRSITIVKVARAILQVQESFFEKGSLSYLKPLRMKDLAEEIGVSESTISRIANNKYLECEWGILPFKFFFSTEIETNRGESQSRESVKDKIRTILVESKKNLSDQKISDMLALEGIKIARRTVAKYRSELDIASSFDR